jgi:HSP20 family protein
MTLMTGFRPLRDFMTLRDAVDRLFDDNFVNPGNLYSLTGGGRHLPIDVYETQDELVVRAHVPGVTPDELEINYQQGVLTLRATTKPVEAKDGWRWYVRELGAGEVTRQITLPREIDVDHATASFENGVLTLTLPKSAAAKPRRIEIGNGSHADSQHQITAQAEG